MSLWRIRWIRRLKFLLTVLLAVKQVELLGTNHTDSPEFSPNIHICIRANTSGLARDGITPISCDPSGYATTGDAAVICVNPEFGCNFVMDCPTDENSTFTSLDELDCATTSCNFEGNSTCGWTNRNASRTSGRAGTPLWGWTVTQGSDFGKINLSTGEVEFKMKDHTLGTKDGHYLFVDFSQARRPGSTALFSTPVIGITADNCELIFHLYIASNTIGKFEVIQKEPSWNGVRTRDKLRQLFFKNFSSSSVNQTDAWMQYSITWPKNKFYTIFFKATTTSLESTPSTGGVAIDDIKFQNCEVMSTTASPTGPLSAFDTACPDQNCDCDKYPKDYCGNGGKCVFDNESLAVYCDCAPGWTGIPCEKTNPDKQLVTPDPGMKDTLTAFFITFGAVMVCTLVGFGVYHIFKHNGFAVHPRDSFDNGYDVSFFVNAHPREAETHSSARERVPLGNRNSNSSFITTDGGEWDLQLVTA